MANRKEFERIDTVNGQEFQINVYYFKGKGYYICVTPVETNKGDGYSSTSSMMFSGVKRRMASPARASAKVEAEVVAQVDKVSKELIDYLFSDKATDFEKGVMLDKYKKKQFTERLAAE